MDEAAMKRIGMYLVGAGKGESYKIKHGTLSIIKTIDRNTMEQRVFFNDTDVEVIKVSHVRLLNPQDLNETELAKWIGDQI